MVRHLAGAALLTSLVLCAGLTACGGDDDPSPVATAATGTALLAEIPTLGERYPAQLARFVDTDEGKDYGLAVTVADDGNVVAYLCDGKSLGRAFSGSIADGADSATLKAVKGDGTVDLELSGDEPSSATVRADDFSDEFTLASTKVGGYYREEVKGVTRGWVVSDALAIKGVQSNKAQVVGATLSGPLSPSDQALVGVQEDPNAPPQTQAFFKNRRCNALRNQYDAAFDDYISPSGTTADANAVNLALAKGRSLGCSWTNDDGRDSFVTT